MPTLGIRYFLHDPVRNPYFIEYAPERFRREYSFDGIDVYEDTGAMHRAFLVGRAEVVSTIEEMYAIMRNADFQPTRTALVEHPLPQSFQGTDSVELGTPRVIERRATHAVVEVNATEDCILVLADAYYPGWEADVDGERADIFPVYSIFRGILLPSGRHTVHYNYTPFSFTLGMIITTVTAGVSLLIAAATLVRIRRRPRVAAE